MIELQNIQYIAWQHYGYAAPEQVWYPMSAASYV